MATSATSIRPAEIDLSLLLEESPTTAHICLDPSPGSSADGPTELNPEGMDIDMADVDVSLFGDEPPSLNGVSTANPFDNMMTTRGNNLSLPSLFDASRTITHGDIQKNSQLLK
jgi:hypothetical protein